MPSSARASALIAAATGWPEGSSTAPSWRSSSARLQPGAGWTATAVITPVVMVPVLSSSTVSTLREDSSAW